MSKAAEAWRWALMAWGPLVPAVISILFVCLFYAATQFTCYATRPCVILP